MSEQQAGLESRTIAAVMLKEESSHPWSDGVWSLKGLVPGLSQQELTHLESVGQLHMWSNLVINLHLLHCDSYYHNLVSQEPKVYLVCNQHDEGELQPIILTVDYDEAASYMETSEQVFNTALPTELCQWLEQFVLTHYQPEEPKKRRRKQWHEEGEANVRKS